MRWIHAEFVRETPVVSHLEEDENTIRALLRSHGVVAAGESQTTLEHRGGFR